MLKIYFDNVLIDEDNYTALGNDYKLFTDSFKLGSTASNSFKLSVNKNVISSHPNEVKIEDDNTTFYLVADSPIEDKYTYTYTLTDKLVDFNFNYDASSIIQEKAELEETCYLSDVWKDMCSQAGVEYDEDYIFLNDIEVSWYDNTIQARKYLSFIAQLQAGYATILENGKQSFKPHKKTSSKTIDIDECSDFILGEKKTITRVVYDTGVVFWAFGDDTGTTIYLDTDNVFITSEEVVENIYNAIVGFEFYLVNVPDAPIDSSIRAGDIITFTDGLNNYPTIAQYSTSYNGGWTGGYELKVNTNRQEETKITGEKETIKGIKTELNRIDGSLKITSEQTNENTSNLTEMQLTTENFTTSVKEIQDNINTINEAIITVEETILTQTENKFEMWFEQTGLQDTVNNIKDVITSNSGDLATLSQYIRFEGGIITLGKSDSQATLSIANDRISFMNGTNESAFITGNQLYITDSTILNKLQVGKWETKPDEYGNLNTRFIND